MAGPKLTLYVDTVSPFAYLAFHVVRTSPVFAPCDITYIPIFLGGVMKACGNTAPINIKNKDKWINLERLRWSRQFNIPMSEEMPDGFPPMTVATQRALCAVSMLAPQKLAEAIAALYHALFVQRKQIAKVDDFGPVLEAVLGKDVGKKVLEKSTSGEAKDMLTANTEKVLADGAFGLPWFVATDKEGKTECFWGFDHLGQIMAHLGLERPKAGGREEGGWKAML